MSCTDINGADARRALAASIETSCGGSHFVVIMVLGGLTPRPLFGRPCSMFCLRKVASRLADVLFWREKHRTVTTCHNTQ